MTQAAADLFRPEAIRARDNKYVSDVKLQAPRIGWLGLWIAAVTVALAANFVAFGTYSHKTLAYGQFVLSPRPISVRTKAASRLERVEVREGEIVAPGQVLGALNSSEELNEGRLADQILRSLAAERTSELQAHALQITRLRNIGRVSKQALTGLQTKHQLLLDQSENSRKQVEVAERAHARWVELAKKGFGSVLQSENQELALLQARSNLQRLAIEQLALSGEIAAQEERIADVEIDIQLAEAANSQKLAALEKDVASISVERESLLRAPIAGTVAKIGSSVGASVGAGEEIFVLHPLNAALTVELRVPASAVHRVSTGNVVLLQSESHPYQKYGYLEGAISSVTLAPDSTPQGVVEPTYLVNVTLDESKWQQTSQQDWRPGVRVWAQIKGEPTKIYRLLFSHGFRHALTEEATAK